MTESAEVLPPLDGASPSDASGTVVPLAPAAAAEPAASVAADVESACALVPPLWTLGPFVAVNPYLGFARRPFRAAVDEIDRLFHARTLMPASFYREQHARGRISDADLREARAEAARCAPGAPAPRVRTVAEQLDLEDGSDWSALVVDEISRWCAARFDLGQAAWRQPWRDRPHFAAWREAACLDRSPELRGVRGFRAWVRRLPEKPDDAIAALLAELGVPQSLRRDLLARQLASIAGWAGHVQYRAREAARAGQRDPALREILAIRLAWDGALAHAVGRTPAWADAAPGETPARVLYRDEDRRFLGQLAYEAGYRRELLSRLRSGSAGRPSARPFLQAVFCIDVRSELLRRQLESLSPAIETAGFAGFFGFPLRYERLGQEGSSARCPVLLSPPCAVRERSRLGAAHEERTLRARARARVAAAAGGLAVGAFSLVETLGHAFGLRLVADSLGWGRGREGALAGARQSAWLPPSLEPEERDGRRFGLTLEERVDLAEGALRNLGLTRRFAEVVLLCGHGSTSANNPHASGLDCGACGGLPGDVNARVAAAVLEDPAVRAGLGARGIHLPDDTRFVAGLHDTTRDEVALLDDDGLDPAQRARIEGWLARAGRAAAAERAERLAGGWRRDPAARLRRRSRDWSEVRPEWGLAGNAAFVAAPRHRTRGVDLQGRVFLHDYEAAADPDGEVLRLVLTAPLVVASWINLQYYASTVDNGVFGCGDKTLHHVTGLHGVMLGNRSDLRPGLPWQSLHDGRELAHEPLRLTAVVEAPRERITRLLHEEHGVRALVENGWIHLLAWDAEAGAFHRWVGGESAWRESAGLDPVHRSR